MNFQQWLWLRDIDFPNHGPHCQKGSSMNEAANVGRVLGEQGHRSDDKHRGRAQQTSTHNQKQKEHTQDHMKRKGGKSSS